MQRILTRLRQGADGVAAAMLAAMFILFLVQIVSRYILNLSLGWTIEACLTLWLWLVLWGAAFCLSDRDHVKFDLVYQMVSPTMRRVFAAISAAAIVIGIIYALPASWDYVDFHKIKKSATLRIPLKWVFIVYMFFCAGLIVRYGIGLINILRRRDTQEF